MAAAVAVQLLGTVAIATPKLSSELLNRFLVVPEYKILMCYIEKVACEAFNRLFVELRAPFDPRMLRGRSAWGKNVPTRHNWTRQDLEMALSNPTWHKVVFLRCGRTPRRAPRAALRH